MVKKNNRTEEIQEKKEIKKVAETEVTKEWLDKEIERGNFRIVKNYIFKDGGKKLQVDYKIADRNYFEKDNPLIEYFKEKNQHQKSIILED